MKAFLKIFALISVLIAVIGAAIGLFAVSRVNSDGDEALFSAAALHEPTAIYAFSDNASGAAVLTERVGVLRKTYFPLSEMGDYITDGILAVEDRIFYQHRGVDFKRTVRAAADNLFGRGRGGASTVTQQVIKNISGDNERTVTRKLCEIVRALRLEKRHSKEEILEVYLNILPMGENIYGVGAAAVSFFGKKPEELSASEAATLIGITNAPTAYSPYLNPERCIKKRNIVLSVMREVGILNEEQYLDAVATPLTVLEREEGRGLDGWFTEAVIREAAEDLAEKTNISTAAARLQLESGGYRIYSTQDPEMQSALERYFADTSNFPDEVERGLKYAMTVMNKKGELLATVGGVGEKRGNRLLDFTEARIIPGSTLKPLALYAPLIDSGSINWATVLDDTPVSFSDGGIKPYPKNSPNVYSGLTTVKEGLVLSKNTLAVRLCLMRGVENCFRGLSEDLGLEGLVSERVSEGRKFSDIALAPMALGQLTDGVSLKSITAAYTVFPSEGVLSECTSYRYVENSRGERILTKEADEKRVFKPTTAKIINKILEEVCISGTAKDIDLGEYTAVAGKTGTSGGNLDKTFIGYTADTVCGIWCGYSDGKTPVIGLSKSHTLIWSEAMLEMLSARGEIENTSFSVSGLLYRPYCRDSGGLYCERCLLDPRGDRLEYGYFTPDNMPSEPCSRHITVEYDTAGKGIACSRCPVDDTVLVSLLYIPERSFPSEVFITDAEFVVRDFSDEGFADRFDLPYFYATLPEGEYAGISKREKQFNRACPLH